MEHAILSPSGSAKWINCPASLKAEESYPETRSSATDEGTLAHALAELCLIRGIDTDSSLGQHLPDKPDIDIEMVRYVQAYLDYVRKIGNDFLVAPDTDLEIEQKVNIFDECWGTVDAIVADYKTRTCHIIDLKYGRTPVYAKENSQLMLYALGVYNNQPLYKNPYPIPITNFKLHIFQPRIINTNTWEVSVTDLLKFKEHAKRQGEIALSGSTKRVAGTKQCKWCKARGDCKEAMNLAEIAIVSDFDNLDLLDPKEHAKQLTDKQKKMILDHKDFIKDFIKEVEKSVLHGFQNGKELEGYKMVEKGSKRTWIDDKKAEEILKKKLGDDAYTQKMIGILQAEKLLGKNELAKLVHKPAGKLVLKPIEEGGKAITKKNVEADFIDLDTEVIM